jgi:hypothetical protein
MTEAFKVEHDSWEQDASGVRSVRATSDEELIAVILTGESYERAEKLGYALGRIDEERGGLNRAIEHGIRVHVTRHGVSNPLHLTGEDFD